MFINKSKISEKRIIPKGIQRKELMKEFLKYRTRNANFYKSKGKTLKIKEDIMEIFI